MKFYEYFLLISTFKNKCLISHEFDQHIKHFRLCNWLKIILNFIQFDKIMFKLGINSKTRIIFIYYIIIYTQYKYIITMHCHIMNYSTSKAS